MAVFDFVDNERVVADDHFNGKRNIGLRSSSLLVMKKGPS
jgi:hypothetical protein